MINNFKRNLHWIEYLVGLVVYFIFISYNQLSLAVVWMIITFYIWYIITNLLNQYSTQTFLYIISFAGVLLAITIFFMHGVEEVPFPKGAVQFKTEGITTAIIVLFISTLPFLVYKGRAPKQTLRRRVSGPEKITTKTPRPEELTANEEPKEEWEEATIEDVESGEYEPI